MPSAEIWKWSDLRIEPFFKVFSMTLLCLGNTSLNLDNFIPSTAGTPLPQRATREDAPGRAENSAQSDTVCPKSGPGRPFRHDLGQPTMIRLLPRTSDGVAGPRLQSRDLRPDQCAAACQQPACCVPFGTPHDLHLCIMWRCRMPGGERQIWQVITPISFFYDLNNVLMSNPCDAAQQAAAPHYFAINRNKAG